MNVTKILSSFIVKTTFGDITSNAIEEAKRCCLDGIGVMLAGSSDRIIAILKEYVSLIGGEKQSSLFCPNSFKSSLINAALVNGASAHILDFDDTHRILGGHPTAVILPVVLALGEYTKASGKDILTALILGVEVSCKIARAVNPTHYQSGYHVTSTLGVFGATAAAANLLKLKEKEVQNALGIAGSMSSGLKENFGTMTKSLHVGMAASNGIKSVLLAQRGINAADRILEGQMGFCNVMCSKPEIDKITKNLGLPWEIEIPGITRKKYPCCARTHPAIDGILKIVNKQKIDHRNLAEIICETDETAFKVLAHPSPTSELEAKFSMPYCIAVAFLEKNIFLQHFTKNWLRNPLVAEIMHKVRHIPSQRIIDQGYENRWASKITINLKSGESFDELVQRPKGDSLNPFLVDEFADKFLRCTQGLLDKQKCHSIIDNINYLENENDISDVIDNLLFDIKFH
jgi:2-methylcitrate dehydratase PrpD